ncbi:MAG: zinc ribbon domain-containing protein [Methylovulum sp.]
MALIKCKECGTDVSSKAKTCPKCGVQVAVKKNGCLSFIGMVFFGLISLLVILGIFGDSSSTVNTSSNPQKRKQDCINKMISNTKDSHGPDGYDVRKRIYDQCEALREGGQEKSGPVAPAPIPAPQKVVVNNSKLLVTTPSKVCNFLNEAGLASGSWKVFYDQEFFCTTSLKELGSGSMDNNPNNIMFSATGNNSTVMQVELVLNINDQASASSAHQELLKDASALSLKATGQQLPQKLESAVNKGNNASQKVGAAIIEIVREDWSTGSGYEVKVTIK